MIHLKTAIALLLLSLAGLPAPAQKFWLTTYSFPGGPKTGIALVHDQVFFAGLTDGVLRSADEGANWTKVLSCGPVYSIHANDDGMVLAGGRGKVYWSHDYGASWDSVAFNRLYPVTGFTQLPDGSVFAITGALDIQQGFVGAGVFFSGDAGLSWTGRNNGLGAYLSCKQIAGDAYGRLYLTVADEYLTGNGGLYVSDDKGLHWEHVDIAIDGQGVIENDVKIEQTTGLTVSPADSLYISLLGKTGTAAVRLNLVRHIDAVGQPGFWQRIRVATGPSWWLDRALNGIHFAQNGDRYSSVAGTMGIGGTYFSKDQGASWNQQQQGLGLDLFGFMNVQHFVEKSSGNVFMVQYLDERIYWADTSRVPTSLPVEPSLPEIRLYPNPAPASGTVTVAIEGDTGPFVVSLFDLQGRLLSRENRAAGTRQELFAPRHAGAYVLQVATPAGTRALPLRVE